MVMLTKEQIEERHQAMTHLCNSWKQGVESLEQDLKDPVQDQQKAYSDEEMREIYKLMKETMIMMIDHTFRFLPKDQ